MKKILEVLQYGEHDIRFNTDFSTRNAEEIPLIISKLAFTMMTKLWGGKETAVVAMIRALAIADLCICNDRKGMVRNLDRESATFAHILRQGMEELTRNGGNIVHFSPIVTPPKTKS